MFLGVGGVRDLGSERCFFSLRLWGMGWVVCLYLSMYVCMFLYVLFLG